MALMMKWFPTSPRKSTFAVRMHKTSLIKQEGALRFQHPLIKMKAVIHLQAKPSHLWGSTMCHGALSVWGHFSSFVDLKHFRVFLCFVVLIVLGAGGAQGSGAGQCCQAHEPDSAAPGSDLLADGKGYQCRDTAP